VAYNASLESVKEVIASLFGHAPQDVSDQARVGELPGWDSLGQVLLVGELEQRYQVSFTIQETAQLTSVQSISELLKSKGVPNA